MPRKFDPQSDREFYLHVHMERITTFSPEKTGPANRSHYVAFSLGDMIEAHLFGLREQVLPTARSILAWMEAQPDPPEGQDVSECFRAYQWWRTLGLCKWLIDGDPAAAAFARASEADWRHWDKFERFEPDGAKLLLWEGLENALPLNLAARHPAVALQLCQAAGLTSKASSAPPVQAAELMYGQWACRHLAEGGQPDATYVAKGEEMLRKKLLSRFIENGSYIKMVLWLKAIYYDSSVTHSPEETIFKAYDTMPGVEKPAFARV